MTYSLSVFTIFKSIVLTFYHINYILLAANLSEGAIMNNVTSPERIITRVEVNERPLKDVGYDELSEEEKKDFIPIIAERWKHERGLKANAAFAIASQEGFEPGFVAVSALMGKSSLPRVETDYDYESDAYTFNTDAVERLAYKEKAIRELTEQAEAEDPEKAAYMHRNTTLDFDDSSEATKALRTAQWADKLWSSPTSREHTTPAECTYLEDYIEYVGSRAKQIKDDIENNNDFRHYTEPDNLMNSITDFQREKWLTDPGRSVDRGELRDKLDELMKSPDTTLDMLRDVFREVYDMAADEMEESVEEQKEKLAKIENDTWVPEDENTPS